jgi:diguanylate cyclase (GGDEF)-like protein
MQLSKWLQAARRWSQPIQRAHLWCAKVQAKSPMSQNKECAPTDASEQAAKQAPDQTFLRYGCETEPIQHIGTVQPHGLVMVLDYETLNVVQVSEGWARHFDVVLQPQAMIGTTVCQWFDVDLDAMRALLQQLRTDLRSTQFDIQLLDRVVFEDQVYKARRPALSGETLLHRVGSYVVIEWAPHGTLPMADLAHLTQLAKLNEMLAILRRTTDEQAFFDAAVDALRQLSGFDRVMLYKFLPDQSGEVLAESVSSKTEVKYLGMRFPAGDIPPQARALYLLNPMHMLADVQAKPDRLIPEVLPSGQPIDQTFFSLRQMSSAHMSYLGNMGIRATMSISLIKNGQLWGLLACHHLSPRVPPHHVREMMQAACELIANVVAMRADDMDRLSYHARRSKLAHLLHQFGLGALKSNLGLFESAYFYSADFLEIFGAQQWAMRVGDRIATSLPQLEGADGLSLSALVMEQVDRLMRDRPAGEPVLINSIKAAGLAFPALLDASGLMAIKFGLQGQNLCVFFRTELVREVRWGGRPEKVEQVAADGSIYLEPRRSFDLWLETVKDRCEDWTSTDAEFLKLTVDTITDHSQMILNHELNEKLRWRARHDYLTGLLNRSTLDAELAILANLPDAHFALFMIDMDHFKRINDSLGHKAGDEVIKEVGKRIASVTRGDDFASRFGGDEFVMVVHLQAGAPDTPLLIARRLLDVMRTPIMVEDTSLMVTLSIGVAVFPEQGKDAVELMRHADIALYDAKGAGRARVALYTAEMEANARDALTLEGELREAVRNNGLCLFYQPKVDLRSGAVSGVEALVRWRHPKRGLLGPNVFVPLAERSDLINDLGDWVMQEAVAQCARWREQGLPALTMAVNVSLSQFASANFLTVLAQSIEEHGVDPDLLEVELTESVVMDDTSLALRVLEQIKDLGVRITLDDFGTGYSSLSYLHQLPLSTLKIDRSFVAGLEHDGQAQLVTRAVLGLARGLGIRTVAEGVEDDYQRRWLMSHGCDLAQGYYFSRPVPPEEMVATLSKIRGKWR